MKRTFAPSPISRLILSTSFAVAVMATQANATDYNWTSPTSINGTFSFTESDTGIIQNGPGPTAANLNVGDGGTGIFNMTGGSILVDIKASPYVANNIHVGRSGGTGTFNMSGGSIVYGLVDPLTTPNYGRLIVGGGAGTNGTFNQSGGSVHLVGSLWLADSGGIGSYNLSNNASLNLGLTAYLGSNGGKGLITVTDSASLSMMVGDVGLKIGTGATSSGTIRQDGANTNVNFDHGAGVLFGDSGGTGVYELKNGTLNMNVSHGDGAYGVRFGVTAGSTGKFIQDGGTSTFDKKALHVGYGGIGEFTLNNGTSTLKKGLVLGNNAGASGTLTVNGGILEVGGTNGIRKGEGDASVQLAGGMLRVIDQDLTTSLDISLEDSITPSTIDTNGRNASLSGIISGDGDLVKQGTGLLILSGVNNYTGSTTVTAGTLVVASGGQTGLGEVVFEEDATLTGTGLVQGFAQISGNLNPGSSPGNLTFAAGLTLEDTATTSLEITGFSAGLYDTITVTSGAFTLDGTLILDITTLLQSPQTLNLFDLSSEATLIGNFNSILLTGAYGSGAFTQDSTNWTLEIDENIFIFDSLDGTLNVFAIPEPGTWALLTSTAAALWMIRRRRTA